MSSPLITQAKLLNDQALQSRITMGILHISNDVLNEDPSTPNHDARVSLAKRAMQDPSGYGHAMYNQLIVMSGINENGADSSQIADQTILDSVSAVWDTFTG
jgi:hypothetical protein